MKLKAWRKGLCTAPRKSGGWSDLKEPANQPSLKAVAEVFRGGENLNLAMVLQGAAFAFRKYVGQCQALRYLSAESEAEFRRAGVQWPRSGSLRRKRLKTEIRTTPTRCACLARSEQFTNNLLFPPKSNFHDNAAYVTSITR